MLQARQGSMCSAITAIPRQQVVGFFRLDSHLFVEVPKSSLIPLVFHLLLGVCTKRLETRLSWLEPMLCKGGTESSRNLGRKMIEMRGEIGDNSNEMKICDVVHVFPIYAAVDSFNRHALPFLINDTSDMIGGMECAGLAIVEAKHSARRSMLQNILLPQPVLENTLVPLHIIRNLAEIHLTPCRSVPYLFLQRTEICAGQRVQRIASRALANAVAKLAKHSLHIDVGLTSEKPQSKWQSEVTASVSVATRNEGTYSANLDLKKKCQKGKRLW
jgi:hypothetical protein